MLFPQQTQKKMEGNPIFLDLLPRFAGTIQLQALSCNTGILVYLELKAPLKR